MFIGMAKDMCIALNMSTVFHCRLTSHISHGVEIPQQMHQTITETLKGCKKNTGHLLIPKRI